MKIMNFVLEEPVFKSMCSSSCITPRYNSFFFNFCQCWVFIAGRGLSPAAATGVGFSLSWLPCCGAQVKPCGLQKLQHVVSVVVVHGLSCSAA